MSARGPSRSPHVASRLHRPPADLQPQARGCRLRAAVPRPRLCGRRADRRRRGGHRHGRAEHADRARHGPDRGRQDGLDQRLPGVRPRRSDPGRPAQRGRPRDPRDRAFRRRDGRRAARAQAAGYRLALDDFRYRDGSEEVLDLFDVVKLSMPELGRQGMRELAARLRPYRGLVLADKLGTRPDHEVCIAAGCDLFQGYFFCRPRRGRHARDRGQPVWRCCRSSPRSTTRPLELSDIEQLVAARRGAQLPPAALRQLGLLRAARRRAVDRPGARAARTRERAALGHAEHAGQHRQQADRADPHGADPRPLLRAGRRPARDRAPPPSCSPSGCSR